MFDNFMQELDAAIKNGTERDFIIQNREYISHAIGLCDTLERACDYSRIIPNKELKLRILMKRQDRKCYYCGRTIYTKEQSLIPKATIDHKKPFSRGGKHNLENLCACCKDCNVKKGNMSESEFRGEE